MFNAKELQLLNSITEEFSRKAKHKKMQNFKEFMGKLYIFLGAVEKGFEATIYDYTNELTLRDQADRLLDEIPPILKKKVKNLLSDWDKRFDEATNVVSEPLLGENPQWWWYRIPKILVGELKEDVESLDIK